MLSCPAARGRNGQSFPGTPSAQRLPRGGSLCRRRLAAGAGGGDAGNAGLRLRVTAPLIRASDGFHLWSQTYDCSADDVIAIREEIAIEIAQALKTAMEPIHVLDSHECGRVISSTNTSMPVRISDGMPSSSQALSSSAPPGTRLFFGWRLHLCFAVSAPHHRTK